MLCPSCGQQTEEGKFCTNCGSPLPENNEAEGEDQASAPVQSQEQASAVQQAPQSEQTETQQQPNEAVEKVKAIGNDFGHFFLTLVKKPSAAKQANQNDWISSVITIAIYAILFAVGVFFTLKIAMGSFADALGGLDELGGMFGAGGMMGGFMESATTVSFVDGMLWPFIKFVILFAVVIAVTFGALKLMKRDVDFLDTLSKYGAYLMLFTLLLILGFLMFFIKLHLAGVFVLFASFLAAVLIIPTILLSEARSNGIDRVYLLLGAHIINLGVFSFLIIKLFIPIFIMLGVDSLMQNMPDIGF